MNDQYLKLRQKMRDQFPRMPTEIVDRIVRQSMDEARKEAEAEIQKLAGRISELTASLQAEPDAVGCKCSVCGNWQKWTPSGMVCKNGHGGARGINKLLYSAPPLLTNKEA